MERLTRAQLEQLTKDELVALVERLYEQLDGLQSDVVRLRSDVDELKRPPATSHNSSLPPSRDQKSNAPPRGRAKRRGGRPGHVRMERAWVAEPTRVIIAHPAQCVCGADLSTVKPQKVTRRQLTELPIIQPVVFETHQHDVCCPQCGQLQRGVLPVGLEAERAFGPRLEAAVTYLLHQQHLGYERTQTTLQELLGVDVSAGGQVAIMQRAGAAAAAAAEPIRAELCRSAVVGSDETGARLNGQTWWEWVFCAEQVVYHVIRPSRGYDVIAEVMGQARAQVWVCDCWAPQLQAPATQHQLCLAHQIRNLQGLRERCPRLAWARELQALLREAIHLAKRRAELTLRGFARRVAELERRLQCLIDRPVQTPAAQALLKRYRKHRAHLFVFLRDPTVPHHNNACERSLRTSVVHRKVIGTFRTEWGAHAYAALASVLDTAKVRGQSVFGSLLALMGPPVLPYLNTSNP